MTPDEWESIALLLDKGFKWREPFGVAQSTTYRVLLDGHAAEQIAGALRVLVGRGQVFGPTPGEIVSLIRSDPSKPTFEEAYQLIYGPRGILWGRSNGQAAEFARSSMHPLVGSFAVRYGIERLRLLEVDHEDYGPLRRKELQAAWDRHAEATEGRNLASLMSPRRGELGLLDPLAAIGVGSFGLAQLPEGEATKAEQKAAV